MGMDRRANILTRAAAVSLVGVLLLLGPGSGLVSAAHIGATADRPPRPPIDPAGDLADGTLREALEAWRSSRPIGRHVTAVGDRLRVEVVHALPVKQARELVRRAGGVIEGDIGNVIQALVPADRLEALESADGIDYLRPATIHDAIPEPEPVATEPDARLTAVVGEHVTKTNAADWHRAGRRGLGVKIGIVDSFDPTAWSAAQAAGEVPAPAGVFCRFGTACDFWSIPTAARSKHGVGVAEVVHDMAPSAQIYLARVGSALDLEAAIDYFAQQGVKIVTRSLGAGYDGPGDGTGLMGDAAAYAVSKGILFLNSAGNNAGPWAGLLGQSVGNYWRGQWSDPYNAGWNVFPGGSYYMAINCEYVYGFRWSDWGQASSRTDYDIYVFDKLVNGVGSVELARGLNRQQGGAYPIELSGTRYTCNANDRVDYVAIKLHAAGSGTSGDVLEFMANAGVQHWSRAYSATQPVADSASDGVIAVGAIGDAPRGGGTTIAAYSSQGPNNAGRIKPDLSAASCISTYSYGQGCFNGTSAATPVVAGAAALALGAGMATTPATLKSWLLGATVERGAAGADNVYGAGELRLPDVAGICPPDDLLEENDTKAQALPLPGAPFNGIACDNDYFSVAARAGETITASLAFTHDDGDLDMALYNASQTAALTWSTSESDNESFSHQVTADGTYFLRVFPYAAGDENTYRLTAEASVVICPPDDSLEENDTKAQALPLPGAPFNGIACDNDYFSVAARAGETITASLAFTHDDGDLDMALYNASQTAALTWSTSESDNESFSHQVTADGTYFLRVFPYAAGDENTYRLTASVTASAAPDGSGTMAGSVKAVSAGATGRTISFTYTAATGGMVGGTVRLTVPSGWSAPSTVPTAPGYVTASVGTLSVSGQHITIGGLTRSAGQQLVIVYGSKAGGGPGATAPAPTTQRWPTRQRSTAAGALTLIAVSPRIRVAAPDGSGTMASNVSSVSAGATAQTITFTYTAATGGMVGGMVRLTVPAGWSAPSTNPTAPGYVTATANAGRRLRVSGQHIIVGGLTRSAGQQLVIVYGSRVGGGPGATAPSAPANQRWATRQRSTANGLLTPIAASPVIKVQ